VSRPVHIIRTGTANLASVCAAINRAALEAIITEDADEIAGARLCVLPGVGAFAAAMQQLRVRRIDRAIADRVRAGRPLLAICLGFQLLLEGSDESPGIAGLGVAPGIARRFPATVRVPQIGWNQVRLLDGFAGGVVRGWAYFANSYRLAEQPAGWTVATSEYGGRFVAAMQRSPTILACQFHPELSGQWGDALIRRWIKEGSA
jgi:imidazole glycerol phosphate synthase glutamine amidotransferase subunit